MKQLKYRLLPLALAAALLTGCSGADMPFFIAIDSSRPLISEWPSASGSSGPAESSAAGEESAAPAPDPEPARYEGELELPVAGASGYAAVALRLWESPDEASPAAAMLEAGQGFTILEESGEWWRVRAGDTEGWVQHADCLINLPDVIPSIVYDVTNGYSSLFRTSGEEIPGITGQALYRSSSYNERLGREEDTVAVQYRMAKKICAAQRLALADGNTLIIYEGFRPYSVQTEVAEALGALLETDASLRAGVETPPWSLDWFIATGVSNHQQGYAIDVSLGKITEMAEAVSGDYRYDAVARYEEYQMPTAMHELSAAAASLSRPVSSKSPTEWQDVAPAAAMNEGALALRDYCTAAGLTPLASEWWHFNDLDCLEAVDQTWKGDFTLSENVSVPPAADGLAE